MDKGRILLAVTGFHPQRWHELLSAERSVASCLPYSQQIAPLLLPRRQSDAV